MRFSILLSSLLLTTVYLHGQGLKISGVVIDANTKEILPFANIMVVGHTIGTTSGRNGAFEIRFDPDLKNDTLIFSYVGYRSIKRLINNYAFDTIKLQPLDIMINEVVVKPSNKKIKPLVLNQFKQKDCGVRYSPSDTNENFCIPTRPKEPTIEVLFFPDKDDYTDNKKIKEVWIQTTNFKTSSSFFNLRLFKADKNNLPGDDLISENIIVEVTDRNQVTSKN